MPLGFTHGSVVTSELADCLYKITEYYAPVHECSLLWNDSDIGVQWPVMGQPQFVSNDVTRKRLSETEVFAWLAATGSSMISCDSHCCHRNVGQRGFRLTRPADKEEIGLRCAEHDSSFVLRYGRLCMKEVFNVA